MIDWTNGPKNGDVADGSSSYRVGGSLSTPYAGLVYQNGQWLNPNQIAATQAQAATSQVSTGAANRLNTLLSDPSSVAQTPGYQFAYNQGLNAVNRTAAARGQLGSGNRLYDLTKYGQGMASQTYNNTFNQLSGLLNRSATQQPTEQSYRTTSQQTAANLGGTY